MAKQCYSRYILLLDVSLFVFWLALRARQNTARLLEIYSDTLDIHTETSSKTSKIFIIQLNLFQPISVA